MDKMKRRKMLVALCDGAFASFTICVIILGVGILFGSPGVALFGFMGAIFAAWVLHRFGYHRDKPISRDPD